MELIIDTGSRNTIKLALKKGRSILVEAQIAVEHSQGEKLLASIEILLNKFKKYGKLSSIAVARKGEGFSSLRIGISVANSLAYALNLPIRALDKKPSKKDLGATIKPLYSSAPKIGKSK